MKNDIILGEMCSSHAQPKLKHESVFILIITDTELADSGVTEDHRSIVQRDTVHFSREICICPYHIIGNLMRSQNTEKSRADVTSRETHHTVALSVRASASTPIGKGCRPFGTGHADQRQVS